MDTLQRDALAQNFRGDYLNLPSKGVLLRYPALQDVTRSHIGIPASARARVAALMHADLVPA